MTEMAESLSIDVLGRYYDGKVRKNVIYRLNKAPVVSTNYKYLLVSDKIEDLATSRLDLFVVKDFKSIKSTLKKKAKKTTGIEVTIADIRKADALEIGRWFNQIRELYKICRSIKCQFIISSGATSIFEMVSGRCFDSLLKICGIRPEYYWLELEEWIKTKCDMRCFVDT